MIWKFDGAGSWEAVSAFGFSDTEFYYRIAVCDDGTFSLNESDDEALGRDKNRCFDSLRVAKEFCEAYEARCNAVRNPVEQGGE